MEFLKGMAAKFLEIDHFVEQSPHLRSCLVFVLLGVVPAVRDTDYALSKREVQCRVNVINRKYGCELVYYEERPESDLRLDERLAFFAAADILMVTSVP